MYFSFNLYAIFLFEIISKLMKVENLSNYKIYKFQFKENSPAFVNDAFIELIIKERLAFAG